MPRRRRPSPSSSSDDEVPNSFSTQLNTGAAVAPTPASTLASQTLAPVSGPDSHRNLDSVLQALADRAEDLSDEENSPLEVVEAYASHAELEVVEASASHAGSEVVEASASHAELPAQAEDLQPQDDCIVTGVSRVDSACAIENKSSNALALNSRDMHLVMHQGQEERERDQQKILERYKALQLRIDSDMKEMMRDPEVSKLSDMSQILDRILTSMTREWPSFAARTGVGSSPSVQGKNPGASGASAEQNRISVLPSQGAQQEFIQGTASQGGEAASEAKQTNAPAPVARNHIVLAEAAATVLLHRAGEKHEVLPPLEETSELIKDMMGELKLAVQKNWTMQEAKDALEATKQGNVYSSSRADAHLRAVLDAGRKMQTPSFVEHAEEKEVNESSITENSATARLLERNPDALEIVSTLQKIHQIPNLAPRTRRQPQWQPAAWYSSRASRPTPT